QERSGKDSQQIRSEHSATLLRSRPSTQTDPRALLGVPAPVSRARQTLDVADDARLLRASSIPAALGFWTERAGLGGGFPGALLRLRRRVEEPEERLDVDPVLGRVLADSQRGIVARVQL